MRMILRQFSKCLMSRSCRKQVILLGLRWIMVVMKKTAVFFKKYLLPYFILMRFHRPVGVVLLLWPTLWALWIAGYGHPSSKNIIIFLLGVIVTRAAGCVINDIADRQFDRHVARTKNRPLTANQIPVSHALVLLFFLCVFALILVCL